MVLVMGISFQARHYYLGASATAPKSCRPWWLLRIKVFLMAWSSVPFTGRSESGYGGGKKGKRLVSDSLEKRSP